jgi:hypothetical protein
MNKMFVEVVVNKLLKVIDSMTSRDHIEGTRRYINLYYRFVGEKHKSFVEIYFKSRIRLLKK